MICLGVDDLCRNSGLYLVVLGVADLGVEVEHGPDLDRGAEPDVVHVETVGPGLAEHERVGPG